MTTILVVDDNPTNRKLLRVTLESEGIRVVEAADGVEALATLDREPVDAIIADILMPRMDGYRLCHEVRASKRWQRLPFIIYSSTYTAPADEKLAVDFGADRFLAKPASARDLLQALKTARGQPRSSRPKPPEAAEDLTVMKEYSAALVRKLGEKLTHLHAANQALADRSRELKTAQEKLKQSNLQLEQRIRERTAQLESANKELEAFSYSVAHDLSAPVRSMRGFSRALIEDCGQAVGEKGRVHLSRMESAVARMQGLIEGLLRLSRVNRDELTLEEVNLSEVGREVIEALQSEQPGRRVEVVIAPDMLARCDEGLARVALENLLGNAWKFTSKQKKPRIEFAVQTRSRRQVFLVRDNGVGFNLAQATQLFAPFHRLHSETEFAGSGIGLATARRVVHRHGGEIWAEAVERRGATFYFTLDTDSPNQK